MASEKAPAASSSLAVARALLCNPGGGSHPMLAVGRPPAVLLPTDRRVAVAMCLAHNGLRARRRQVARLGTAVGIGMGLSSLLGERLDTEASVNIDIPDGLMDRLSERLGTEIRVGVGLGEMDAYWKPVLQLFDRRGRDVAFAKVGWTRLTRELVRNEAEMLGLLDGGRHAAITPRLLHSFRHGDLQVVVTEPLPRRARRWRPDRLGPPPDALVALGEHGPSLLGDLPWWRELQTWTAAGAPLAGKPMLPELLEEVGARIGDRPLDVGLQHGDWVPWNLAHLRGESRPVVWDWEYGRPGGPVGLDLVHGRYQCQRLLGRVPASIAFERAHRRSPPELALLHAALIAARRCWVASFAGRPPDDGDELESAVTALGRRLAGNGTG